MKVVKRLARLWIVPVVLVVWELLTRAMEQVYFPAPSLIAKRIYEMWLSGPIGHLLLTDDALNTFAPSLGRLFAGWLVAGLVGVALGIAVGRSARLADYVDPLVQFFRAIPPPLLVPIFFGLMKIGNTTQIITIVSGVIWPVLLNAIDGARAMDRQYLETSQVFGFSKPDLLWRVMLPAAAPKIFAGLRLSLSLALILMVVSELVASNSGIGYRLISAQRDFEMPEVWACIVAVGVLGFLLNFAFLLVEGRVLAWHRGARQTM